MGNDKTIYNFDEVVDRENTCSIKHDNLPADAVKGALPLWVADMDFPCAAPILDALHKRIDQRIFGYTRYGSEEFKNAVTGWFRRRFDWEVDPGHVFYSPGVVPAFTLLVQMLCGEGDGVIIQKPVYHPFTDRLLANHRQVVNCPLLYENGEYRMDYEDLEEKLKDEKNKGLLFCSPHNPVGRVWSEEELKKMVSLCKKYDKWIISDEIHSDLTRNGVVHHPLLKVAPEYRDRIIVCTAPSKTFNLAGMHLSNLVIPNPDYQKQWVYILKDQLDIDTPSPFGVTATIAAYTDGDNWLDQVKDYIDGNISYIHTFVKKHMPKAHVTETQGTYLVWLDMRGYCGDPVRLEKYMHQTAGVVLNEGYIFGEEGAGFERINAASPRSVIVECMERICGSLEVLT